RARGIIVHHFPGEKRGRKGRDAPTRFGAPSLEFHLPVYQTDFPFRSVTGEFGRNWWKPRDGKVGEGLASTSQLLVAYGLTIAEYSANEGGKLADWQGTYVSFCSRGEGNRDGDGAVG